MVHDAKGARRAMKTVTGVALSIASLAGCGTAVNTSGGGDTVTIPIGALADNTGTGATLLYGAAIGMAAAQMNNGLSQAGKRVRFDALIHDSQSDAQHSQDVALRLINDDGVKGIVSDISADTLALNRLNYDPKSPARYKVPITCYLCSSAFFNNPEVLDRDAIKQAAERDDENWLFRLFLSSKYESTVATQVMLHRGSNGDIDENKKFKVSVYAQ